MHTKTVKHYIKLLQKKYPDRHISIQQEVCFYPFNNEHKIEYKVYIAGPLGWSKECNSWPDLVARISALLDAPTT